MPEADFCRTFTKANVYGRPAENPDGLADEFDSHADAFDRVNESELADLSRTFGELIREQGAHRKLSIYLTDNTIGDELDGLEKSLREHPGVDSVQYISQEEAFERFTAQFKDDPSVAEGIGPADLPASFEVLLDDSAALDGLEKEVRKERVVDDVRSAAFLDLIAPVGKDKIERVVGLCLASFGGSSTP